MIDLSIPREDSLWLNSKEEIFAILKQLYHEDTLLTIFYKNIFCVSTIVDYDQEYLWLDAASNKEDSAILIKQSQLYLLTHTTSIPIFMELTDGVEVIIDGKPTWRFSIPKRVHKRQRRNSFRAYFPLTINNNVKLADSTKKIYITDLSLTGLGLVAEDLEKIEIQQKYPLNIQIAATSNMQAVKIDFTVIVRYIGDMTNGKKRIGVEFVNTNRTQDMFLSKWQNYLQLLNKNKDITAH